METCKLAVNDERNENSSTPNKARSCSYTLGPKVSVMYILGALGQGYLKKARQVGSPLIFRNPFIKEDPQIISRTPR